ncbi:MAG: GntR family transcriptional regulator [Rhodothermales bacterium]|nr:GntR family transcriptional regulator [Rhodothermales bacterium]
MIGQATGASVVEPGPTLAETAYERVEHLIVTLELEPGAVFSENALAESLGIGRTPLREALQRLAGEGLVTAIPRRGMMVTPLDLRSILAIIETRKALDRIIAVGVAARATAEQRQRIQQASQILERSHGSAAAFMEADYRLDEEIWAAAPNPFAVNSTRPLHSHCRRFWYRHRNDEDLARSADLHAAVVEAMIQGDPVSAGERSDKLMDYLTLFTKHILIAI